MKSLTLQQMESVEAGSKFTAFCAGFGATQAGIWAAVKIGLIAAPAIGAGMATVVGLIDVACAVAAWEEYF